MQPHSQPHSQPALAAEPSAARPPFEALPIENGNPVLPISPVSQQPSVQDSGSASEPKDDHQRLSRSSSTGINTPTRPTSPVDLSPVSPPPQPAEPFSASRRSSHSGRPSPAPRTADEFRRSPSPVTRGRYDRSLSPKIDGFGRRRDDRRDERRLSRDREYRDPFGRDIYGRDGGRDSGRPAVDRESSRDSMRVTGDRPRDDDRDRSRGPRDRSREYERRAPSPTTHDERARHRRRESPPRNLNLVGPWSREQADPAKIAARMARFQPTNSTSTTETVDMEIEEVAH